MKTLRKDAVTLKLTDNDRLEIKNILKKGHKSTRVFKRAMVLNLFDKDYLSPEISKVVEVTPETARRIAQKYCKEGLNRALYDNPRPGKERLLSKKQENEIIAVVCSDPPEGRQRWTLELLKEEIIKKKLLRQLAGKQYENY